MLLFTILCHILTLLCHIMTLSHNSASMGSMSRVYWVGMQKILTFPEFSSNYNHVLTTRGSYICFQHRTNNSSPPMTQIMIGSVWGAQLSFPVIQLICDN